MPVKFDDVAQHAQTLPNLGDRIAAFLEAIKSRLQSVDGNDKREAMLSDLNDHHDLMVGTIVGDLGHRARSPIGRLGPNETPIMPGDRIMTAAQSEAHANPVLPRDASGGKVHPADAFSRTSASDPARAQGFGGNGAYVGAGAAGSTTAGLEFGDDVLDDRRPGNTGIAGDRQPSGKKRIPVINGQVVEGSEREANGVHYITKRYPDGTSREVVDRRPPNAPL